MRAARQLRLARVVAGLVTLAVVATLLSLTLGTTKADAAPGEGYVWTLELSGGSLDTALRNGTNPPPTFNSTSVTTTRGTVSLSFVVDPGGALVAEGTPTGTYTEAAWHLEGIYDDEGFNCDVPVTAEDFDPVVSGAATDTGMVVTVDLPDAVEENEDMDCGGDFTAFAGSVQKLRESLDFCGPIRLPYAATHSASCRKWQRTTGQISSPAEGTIDRRVAHSWDLTLTRTGSGPTASPDPGPTDGPSEHRRRSLLSLRKHLNALGAVILIGWGAPECVDSVPVKVQRRVKRNGSVTWKTEKSVVTDSVGVWSTKVRDVKGRYRALAPEVVVGESTCNEAVSDPKTHKHRR